MRIGSKLLSTIAVILAISACEFKGSKARISIITPAAGATLKLRTTSQITYDVTGHDFRLHMFLECDECDFTPENVIHSRPNRLTSIGMDDSGKNGTHTLNWLVGEVFASKGNERIKPGSYRIIIGAFYDDTGWADWGPDSGEVSRASVPVTIIE